MTPHKSLKPCRVTETTIILDGIHRWFTFKEKGIKKIASVEWKDKPLDYEKNRVALLPESAECNISHGDRLSPGDKRELAEDVCFIPVTLGNRILRSETAAMTMVAIVQYEWGDLGKR